MSARTTVKSIQDIMRKDVGVDGDAQRLSQLCWMFFLKIIDDQDLKLEVMEESFSSPIPTHLQWRHWAKDPEGITGDELLEFINQELFTYLKEMPLKGSHPNRGIGTERHQRHLPPLQISFLHVSQLQIFFQSLSPTSALLL